MKTRIKRISSVAKSLSEFVGADSAAIVDGDEMAASRLEWGEKNNIIPIWDIFGLLNAIQNIERD